MKKQQLGNVVIFGLVLLNVALYLIFPPPDNGEPTFVNQLISEMLSSSAMILMACAMVLANKPRFLESFFGGLDQMYKSHKTAALSGIALVTIHFFSVPLTQDPYSLGRLLGKIALIGLAVLVLLTLAPRVPVVGGYVRLAYHQWRWTHKFIGLFFIIGFFHMLQVDNISESAPIPNLYWNVIVYVGMAAYLYKELLSPFLNRPHAYAVEAVRKLNGSTLEVTLKPKGSKPAQTAGQFAFVSFEGDPVLGEAHPFTVSSSPKEGSIRFSIKASGDWTRHLYDRLTAGTPAKVDGCYGRLDYKRGGRQQIWVAGGIGVTPFLSWMRDFDGQLDRDIDFYYTVRGEADVLFWDEFVAADKRHDRFQARLNVSGRDGSLTVAKIAETTRANLAEVHVYMCGPFPMTEALKKQFIQKGVPPANIHYEEFNFR
jgi:predicted ferric reductase